ncbi:MAG: fumarylacetoacetate hydrolase family protein [Reyranella sp.]|nr:fumarylacetoacetate hydrolase family protein [Reyranella sp.]
MTEYRRILLDGSATQVVRHGDVLVAGDGREVGVDEAIHLPPSEPSKIIAVHLNYASRTEEFMTKLPAAPTYFHKPVSALNSHKGSVVRPQGCRWLNFEGEIVIVIAPPGEAGAPDGAVLDTALRTAMAGASIKDAASEVAARFGLKRRDVYARALELKREGAS